MAKKLPTDERFMKAWQGSDTADEVSRKTGLTLAECYRTAVRLRHEGFRLKVMPPLEDGPDVELLNQLAATAAKRKRRGNVKINQPLIGRLIQGVIRDLKKAR